MIVGAAAGALMMGILAMPAFAKGGFDTSGYNDTARIFNGTGMQWCMDKVGDIDWCNSYLGSSINDKIVMKWNAAWDACNKDGTPEACKGAWTSNEWNGMANGSESVWHYKIVWVGPCSEGEVVVGGGYCLWGQYSVLMDQGTYLHDGHVWYAPHAISAGYGAY